MHSPDFASCVGDVTLLAPNGDLTRCMSGTEEEEDDENLISEAASHDSRAAAARDTIAAEGEKTSPPTPSPSSDIFSRVGESLCPALSLSSIPDALTTTPL